mgnify:CR=1 FL=1
MAMVRIGVISDTHGLLRPEVAGWLEGCSCIVNAGDFGRESVLEALEVREVRGEGSAIRLESTYLVARYAGRFDVKMRLNADFNYDVRRMESVRQRMEAERGEEVAGSIDLTQEKYSAVFSEAGDQGVR